MDSCPLIPADWELPDVLRYRLGHGPGRQRALECDDHLLLILHQVPKPSDRQRVGQLFWREPDGTWHSSTGHFTWSTHIQNDSRLFRFHSVELVHRNVLYRSG